MKIPLARPYYTEEEINAIKSVLNSRWVAQGPIVEKFEKKFAEYIGTKYAIAVNSCTSALHLSLLAIGIKKNDEVILPDFTFPATGNAILYTGAKPILVDIDLKTKNIDINQIEDKITDKTKAILPVDLFGNPVDMNSIQKISKKYNLFVVEDAACSVGAELDNKKVGSLSDITSFSFHARKMISTGEGGIIITDRSKFFSLLQSLRSHGMSLNAWKREHENFQLPSFDILGYNFRMSDITASIGIAQLKKINTFIERRRLLAQHYNNLFEDNNMDVILPYERNNTKHVYQSYVIILKTQGFRNKIINKLRDKGIGCTIGTYSLSCLPLFNGNCLNGKYAFENSISLPMYHELKFKDIEFIVKSIKTIFKDLGLKEIS